MGKDIVIYWSSVQEQAPSCRHRVCIWLYYINRLSHLIGFSFWNQLLKSRLWTTGHPDWSISSYVLYSLQVSRPKQHFFDLQWNKEMRQWGKATWPCTPSRTHHQLSCWWATISPPTPAGPCCGNDWWVTLWGLSYLLGAKSVNMTFAIGLHM